MPDTVKTRLGISRQYRLLAIVFAGIFVLVAGGYFAFLKLNFSPLYQGLNTQDAALIVEELEAREVRYKLRNGGADILVPFTQVASVRLAIIGSDAPMKSLSGFELFNDSQMGLTDFDQKIKYQRALQGELSRTIMMMSDIETARVHLAIPERALFRASQSIPKAAVTIILKSGASLSNKRIGGIQQLVAASIPELVSSRVVVINSMGEVISKKPVVIDPNNASYIASTPSMPLPRLKTEERTLNGGVPDISLLEKPPANGDGGAYFKENSKESIDIGGALEANVGHPMKPVDMKPVDMKPRDKTSGITMKGTSKNTSQVMGSTSHTLLGGHGKFYTALGFLLLILLGLVVRKIKNNQLSSEEHLDFAEQLKLKLQVYEGRSNA